MPSLLDWSHCPADESNPDKRNGAWVLKANAGAEINEIAC